MKLFLILALTVSSAFGQTGDGAVPAAGDNIESLVETLKTNALPKSEFVTTQVYEAQRQAAQKIGSMFRFVLDATPKAFIYDADSRMMTVSVPTDDHIFIGQNPSRRPVINVHFVKRSERDYIGSLLSKTRLAVAVAC